MAHDARIDAYLAGLPAAHREILQRLRVQVGRLVPEAVETISYGMPAFKLRGRFLVSFAGWKRHCSIYPLSQAFTEAHADELRGYARTKASLHFTTAAPLSERMIDDLVSARLVDLEASKSQV
ncbi:MAG TPA: DUF1801 domain-containing protein [Candidatus Limnocylindria bacterium]|nr:DUF1801 domain-containing protein [Candidatus Limnocylindria bacterium]